LPSIDIWHQEVLQQASSCQLLSFFLAAKGLLSVLYTSDTSSSTAADHANRYISTNMVTADMGTQQR
jgi:hypothetical protein